VDFGQVLLAKERTTVGLMADWVTVIKASRSSPDGKQPEGKPLLVPF
jgi:hypothetical protein